MSVYPRQKTGELVGLFFLAACGLLLLALLTYNGLDRAASVATPSHHYANYAGRLGAWLADYLFQLLGLAALLLPWPLLAIGYRKLRGQEIKYPFLKLGAFSLTLLSLSAGLALVPPPLPESVNFSPGGIAGLLFSAFLVRYLNRPGSLIVLGTLLAGSLILSTRLSIQALLAWLQTFDWNLPARLSSAWGGWRARQRDRRKLARLSQEERTVVQQPQPRKTMAEVAARSQAVPLPAEVEHSKPLRREGPRPKLEVRTPRHSAPGSVETLEADLEPPRLRIRRPYQRPSLGFLQTPRGPGLIDETELMERASALALKCSEFEVHGRVLQIHPGPVVTTFEFKPDPGIKYSRITNLSEDLCLALRAESVRIDRIPGKNTVGIEVPNETRQIIWLREILEGTAFQQSPSPLTLALGKLINGNTYVTDLTRMPHLLIAGATGSGKSVALNAMVCSILYKASPEAVRFIMIDPKRLELGVYRDIPHLLTPIVADPRQASNALAWAVREMEERYKLLARYGVRNIGQYNQLVAEGEEDLAAADPLPYLVVIVDELADLMMTAGKEVEASLTRLAQMARAIGIHLILATQRPSVDVLTGLIKANFPCRISFRVSSRIDSRTIIDGNGAEQLLGQGDMLFLPPGTSRLVRIHGAFITEKEIHLITAFLRRQASPEYREEILAGEEDKEAAGLEVANLEDSLYPEAARFVAETGKASTSLLQRRFRVGYGRAARLLDMMEHEGLVGPPAGSKAREVLVSPTHFSEVEENSD